MPLEQPLPHPPVTRGISWKGHRGCREARLKAPNRTVDEILNQLLLRRVPRRDAQGSNNTSCSLEIAKSDATERGAASSAGFSQPARPVRNSCEGWYAASGSNGMRMR